LRHYCRRRQTPAFHHDIDTPLPFIAAADAIAAITPLMPFSLILSLLRCC